MVVDLKGTWNEKIQQALDQNLSMAIVIGLSAGKDSTAVALLFKQRFPKLEPHVHFVFADTGAELKETYEYLDRLEKYFKKPIKRLVSKAGTLEAIIEKYGGYLPSARSRYCTRLSKIVPFRDYMDDLAANHDVVFNLVGIRADEPTRTGYEPCGQYATKVFTEIPLSDEGMKLQDVFKLVEEEVGLPDYYKWRTRSGCYFCFYQRRIEWVNLKEEHPDLFEKAKSFEKVNPKTGKQFTWIKGMSLTELEQRADKIKKRYLNKLKKAQSKGETLSLTDSNVFEELMQELEPDLKDSCSVCR